MWGGREEAYARARVRVRVHACERVSEREREKERGRERARVNRKNNVASIFFTIVILAPNKHTTLPLRESFGLYLAFSLQIRPASCFSRSLANSNVLSFADRIACRTSKLPVSV